MMLKPCSNYIPTLFITEFLQEQIPISLTCSDVRYVQQINLNSDTCCRMYDGVVHQCDAGPGTTATAAPAVCRPHGLRRRGRRRSPSHRAQLSPPRLPVPAQMLQDHR